MYSAPPPPPDTAAADAVADADARGVGNDLGEGGKQANDDTTAMYGGEWYDGMRTVGLLLCCTCTSFRAVPSINLLNINDYLRKKVVHRSQVGLVNIG